MPIANGIIRTPKQLPEVSRTVVWGRIGFCLAGIFCDWWGGNIEKLIRQIAYCLMQLKSTIEGISVHNMYRSNMKYT